MGSRGSTDSELMVPRLMKHSRVLPAISLHCQAHHDLWATPLAFPEQGLLTNPLVLHPSDLRAAMELGRLATSKGPT